VRLSATLSPHERRKLPFKPAKAYLFLGEIPNMPGHCVVADIKTGRLLTGYHTSNFVEVPDDET
jgi:hypothetical protein